MGLTKEHCDIRVILTSVDDARVSESTQVSYGIQPSSLLPLSRKHHVRSPGQPEKTGTHIRRSWQVDRPTCQRSRLINQQKAASGQDRPDAVSRIDRLPVEPSEPEAFKEGSPGRRT